MSFFRSPKHVLVFSLLAFIAGNTPAGAASPCSDVNRKLTLERGATLAPIIAKQLGVKKVHVMQSFRFNGWSIYYVDPYQLDVVYVFYAHDPSTSRYVTVWGGAARSDEEQSIKAWVLKNAPGIPDRLASCFAWHVTHE